MKKITLLLVALAATTFMTGQTVLSHSTDESEIAGGVACADQTTNIATENSFWRSYTPSEFGVTEAMALTSIEFGVGTADFAVAPYTVTVNLYSSDDVFPAGTFTLITTQEVPVVEADAGTKLVVTLDAPYNVQPDEEIIIEVMDDDEAVNFRIGQNTLGETAPSYLSSIGCEITTPTPTEDIGAFNDDFILNAVLSPELGVGNNELSQISIFPNPASDVLNIKTPATVEINSVAIYDVLGKRSNVTLENGQINVANLAKGVYILSAQTSAGTLTQKIVKN